MYSDKMIELVLLQQIIAQEELWKESDSYVWNGKEYSVEKLLKRFRELRSEFLEPYVIDSTSKE